MFTAAARADTIVQEGSLSGYAGEPQYQDIPLQQFDTMGGTRQLNFIQLDFVTAVIGGGMTPQSGSPVSIYVMLQADYYLGPQLLAETMAVVDIQIGPSGPSHPFSVFDNDIAQVVLDQPADMEAWIGEGQITMTAFVHMILEEDPPGGAQFSASGSVNYSVTYDYDVITVPGDITGDGLVNVADFLELLAAWGPCHAPCPPSCPADLDGDCTVGVLDFLVLLANWT
ncbi:MAG: hypothetical protein ACYS15_14650 [Planctomycetota bacterium]|jgi:hypothetical protein